MAKKYIMQHPNYHAAVGGKLTKIEKGSIITLTDEQAEKLGSKVTPVDVDKVTDLTPVEDDDDDDDDPDLDPEDDEDLDL